MVARNSSGSLMRPAASTSSASSTSAPCVLSVVPEDVITGLAAQLDDMRSDLLGSDDPGSYFRVRVLGGRWSATSRGVAATDIGSYAKNRDTEIWCSGVGWPSRKSFAVNRYGHAACRHLAAAYCRKGDFFFKAWMDAGSPAPFNFEPLVGAYEEDDEYAQWFSGVPIESPSFEAALQLQNLTPRPVPA